MGLSCVCALWSSTDVKEAAATARQRKEREKNKKKTENNFLHFFSFLRLRRRRRLFSLSFPQGRRRTLSFRSLSPSGTSDEGESRWVTKKPNRKWRPSPSSEPSRPPPPSWDLDVSSCAS